MSDKEILKNHEESFMDREIGPCWVSRDANRVEDNIAGKEKINDIIFVPGSSKHLLSEIIIQMDSAVNNICIASFLISNQEIVDAALRANGRGVDVYILTASETKLSSEPSEDNEFEKKTIEEHKKLLDNLAGKVLVRTAQHLHTKFILVDATGNSPQGFLLTSNLTTEALTRNPEIGIKIEGTDVKDLFKQFCTGFWNETERELLEASKLSVVGDKMKGYVPESFNSNSMLFTTSKLNSIQGQVVDLINETNGELWACSFGFNEDNEVMKSLISAVNSGRNVNVLSRPRPHVSSRDALLKIVENGGNVYGINWLHAKCVVAAHKKGYKAIVMTANFEDRGMVTGFETGKVIEGNDANDLKDLLESWAKSSDYKLIHKTKRGNITGRVKLWEANRLIEKTVETLYEIDLGTIKKNKPKKFPLPNDTTKLYHKHRYTWRTISA